MGAHRKDWKAIETDFLSTGMSYSALAKKWDVPLSTLKKKAMSGGWTRKHNQVVVESDLEKEPWQDGTEPKAKTEPVETELVPEQTSVELAIMSRMQRQKKLIEVTDQMMDRIIDAMGIIKPDDTYALMTLIRGLKELREIQGLNKSALDIEEQQARIAKLRREAQQADESRDVTISIMGMTDAEVAEALR